MSMALRNTCQEKQHDKVEDLELIMNEQNKTLRQN